MQIRIRFPLRHPFFPDWAATPARLAKRDCPTLSGSFKELSRAAASGIRPSRSVFVMLTPDTPSLTDRDRDTLWEAFQVPAFALLLDGEGRLVGYECEVHDGLHIGSSCPNTDAQEGILTGEDSVLGYRLPLDRFTVESSACECGRPGQRLRYVGQAVLTCPPPLIHRPPENLANHPHSSV